MQVSNEFKAGFINSSTTKHIQIYFPNLNHMVPEVDVYNNSMSLSEQLVGSQSLEFVGCIATKFEIDIRDFGVDIKDQPIIAYTYPEGLEVQKIRLFTGVVDEAKLQSNHKIKKIVAYDELYTKGQKDVSDWYKKVLKIPTGGQKISNIWRSLLDYIGLQYIPRTLPADNFKIKKKYYNPSNLSAIEVLKSICQINGVFGKIDRNGIFKFVVLPEINTVVEIGAYPGVTLYPPFYPGEERVPGTPQNLPTYKSLDYQEYTVQAIDRVTIRQSGEDEGITVGNGPNRYIIQGNIFTYKMSKSDLRSLANAILANIGNVSFTPYSSNNIGLPWLECGEDAIDCVVYDFEASEQASTPSNPVDVYSERMFYVLNRTLKGTQNLMDSYEVQGDKYQRETVSDIGVNIDLKTANIKQEIIDEVNENLEENYYDRGEIDDMFAGLPEGWSVESVEELPPSGQMQVLYLIQGEVVVE